MQSVITIYLNEIGQKAFNTKTKVLYTNQDKVTDKDVYDLFPKELIYYYVVSKSFLELGTGDYVIVVNPQGLRLLGVVTGHYRKTLDVRLEGIQGNGYCRNYFTFNADGVESTHAKDKYHLEWSSLEEITSLRELQEKQPFLDILHRLAEASGEGIKIDDEKVVVPDWLSADEIKILHDQIFLDKEDEDY